MDYRLSALRMYMKTASAIAPKSTAVRAFNMFQKVRKKDIREREEIFYEKADLFQVPFDKEPIDGFRIGRAGNPLVFLVHGWDSNAGSMAQVAFSLIEAGYEVIAMNLPGHAFAQSNTTNLIECRAAFDTFLKYVNPRNGFSIVSHSFGSAVVAYTLAQSNYKADKLVFLSNPNKMENIFTYYRDLIALGDRAYQHMVNHIDTFANEKIYNSSVASKLIEADKNFNQLLLIHDKEDKILLWQNALEVAQAVDRSILSTVNNTGHYRMLWNKEVIQLALDFLK